MAEIYKDLWKSVIGRYSWKLMELISVLVIARLFVPADFGYGFYVITIVSMIYPLFILNHKSKDTKTYSYLLSFCLIIGIIGAVGFLAASYFAISDIHLPYMLRSLSLCFLISMISVAPESYYRNEKQHEKIYRASLISQAIMIGTAIIFFFMDIGYQSILFSYLVFLLVRLYLLWRWMKIKLSFFSFDKEIFNNLNLAETFFSAILRYGMLFLIPFFFNMESFAYLYLTMYLGFFLYENITVFLTDELLQFFKGYLENPELFNLNLVRFIEYVSFVIMPFSIIPLLLSKNIFRFIFGDAWQIYDILFVFVIAGTVKSIFEIPNIVLMAKDKLKPIVRIRIFDTFSLALFSAILGKSLGLFGVSIAVFLSSLLSSMLFALASFRILKLNVIGVSKEYFYTIFIAVLTMLFLGLLKEWFNAESIVATGILWFVGTSLFVVSIYLINSDFLKRFTRFVFSILGENK